MNLRVTPIGRFFGSLFCLYLIAFRWLNVRAKYGMLDLHYWAAAMVFGAAILADVLCWGLLLTFWELR